MELDKHYNPQAVEDKWYKFWMDKGFFNSTPDEREPYTIVIPPPNVTGVLHMGHMLNNTIQDVLIRKARMEGKNACWVPGTDHASIATEAKVVKKLAEQGIKKTDISRDEFLGHAWEWKNKYGGIILEQLQKLGASCDWNRTRFTMEEELSNAVTEVFVKMYRDGLIYRGTKMVNWDPAGKTTLSDEEVIFKENNAQLFYVNYKFTPETLQALGLSEGALTVATTRPETIMGDVAICVHPEDERYKHLVPGYMLRHKCKPGITGWAQVNGLRGETDTLDKMQRRVEHDLYYISHWSFWLDLRIFVGTVFKGFSNKNAY